MMTVSAVFSVAVPMESKKLTMDLGVLQHIAGVRNVCSVPPPPPCDHLYQIT
jgi:hypothetical protein